MKKLIQLSALAAAVGFSGTALACTADTPNQQECLIAGAETSDPMTASNLINTGAQGPFKFSGATYLVAGSTTANCTLELEGFVTVEDQATSGIPGGVASIDVTGGNIKGGGTCGLLGLKDFPWKATLNNVPGIPGDNGGDISPVYSDYAIADMNGIAVTLLGIPLCNGTLPNIKFFNGAAPGDPSYFDFNGSFGSCSVTGALLAIDAANDVDAW